jgi:phosphoribosyl 1,2-cyclic phosphodiesterase
MSTNKVGKIINLGSSSEGNSFLIEVKRNEHTKPYVILLECGFPYETIMKKLLLHGVSLNDVDAVLVTHEHGDHAQAIKELHRVGKKIYAPKSTFEKYDLKIDNKQIMEHGKLKHIASGIKVLGLKLDHLNSDGSECENLGYVINVDDEFNIGFFTDTKYIKYDLSKMNFDILFIESNNTIPILKMAIRDAQENGNVFKVKHYQRVLDSHMTVEHTAKTLASMNLKRTKIIYLIHLTSDKRKNERDYINIVKNKLLQENKRVPLIYVADHRGNFLG